MTNSSSRNIPCLFHSAACTGLIAHSPVDQKENIIKVLVKRKLFDSVSNRGRALTAKD